MSSRRPAYNRTDDYEELREVSHFEPDNSNEGGPSASYYDVKPLSRRARKYLSEHEDWEAYQAYEEEGQEGDGWDPYESIDPYTDPTRSFDQPLGYRRGDYEAVTLSNTSLRGSLAWAPVPNYAATSADTALKWGLIEHDGSPTPFGNAVMGRSWSTWLVEELQEKTGGHHNILGAQRTEREIAHLRGLWAEEEKVARSMDYLNQKRARRKNREAQRESDRKTKSLPSGLKPLHIQDPASATPQPSPAPQKVPRQQRAPTQHVIQTHDSWQSENRDHSADIRSSIQRHVTSEDAMMNLASPEYIPPKATPAPPHIPPIRTKDLRTDRATKSPREILASSDQQPQSKPTNKDQVARPQPEVVSSSSYCCPPVSNESHNLIQRKKPSDNTEPSQRKAQPKQPDIVPEQPMGENRDIYWMTSLWCCV